MLPNFENRGSQKLILCKPLEELLSNYYVLHPNVSFVFDGKSHWMYDGKTGREIGDDRQIGFVSAYEDSQFLGSIRVVWKDYRGSGRRDVYAITSDNIQKRRGHNRQMTETKDAHKAIKIMEDAFRVKNNSAYRTAVVDEARSCMSSMIANARYKVSRETDRLATNSEIAMFLLAHYEGTQPKLEGKVAELFSTDEKLQNFHNLRIALSMESEFDKDGMLVVEYSNGLMWYTPNGMHKSTELARLNSTYDLPQNYQEKLALIKLCEPIQPVAHVGVFFKTELERDPETRVYYLVGGDTVTTC